MTVTPEQIAKAREHGLTNVEHLAAACDKLGFPFFLACTILQKETGGANIYGHDKLGIYSQHKRLEVTEENFREFLRLLKKGKTDNGTRLVSNGVGPMQITWPGFFPDAEKQGLKLWEPADNILYGVQILSRTWKSSKGDIFKVGRAYNGAESYGHATVTLAKTWKARVGTADLEVPEPEPEPLEPPEPTGDPILDMIAALPLKHSKTPAADYVTYQGEHFLPLDLEIILRCAAAVGWGPVKAIKGGLEGSGGVSAATHAWFGAADLRTRDHKTAEVWEFAAALIRSGVVAFPRGYGKDSFDPHLHLASREAGKLGHISLRRQISEFLDGGDGLVGSKEYHGPSVRLGTWKQSPYNPANITADTAKYLVNTSDGPLLGLDVDRKIITRTEQGTTIVAAKRVKRWDRENVVTADETYYAAEFLSPVVAEQPTEEEQP